MRTFVALPVRADLPRSFLARCRETLQDGRPDVKWVAGGHFHVTLRFLGEIDDSQAEDVKRVVLAAAASTPPIETYLEKPGAFPSAGHPQTIWMGVRDEDRLFAKLETEIARGLETLGFAPEKKPFHPHVTLGRMRTPRGAPAVGQALRAWPADDACWCRFDRLVLYKSELTPSGPVYTALLEAPLGH